MARAMVVLLFSSFIVMFSGNSEVTADLIEYTSGKREITVEMEGDTAPKAAYLIGHNYLVQSCYGFGLALNESFDSTGLGIQNFF